MKEYLIYWMKEEIAYHFFHKSDVLYRFLTAYESNCKEHHLADQYEYITKPFPEQELISHIKQYCQENDIDIEIVGNTVELYKADYFTALTINNKQIKTYCYTIHCAEQLIFPILRLFHPLLFIMNENIPEYGWISPFVKSEQADNKEILYSLR